jgi:uncharacterized protein (TIGR02246 family)
MRELRPTQALAAIPVDRDSGPQVADKHAIRALLARLAEAWAKGDASAYAACFTEDASYITFNGLFLKGRAENLSLHDALFKTILKGTTISSEIVGIELLSDNIGLVHTASTGRKESLQTYVVVRTPSGWLIRSFQNTRIDSFSAWITQWFWQRKRQS